MKKLLIACLNLLLVFNSIGFQAINATEVDPPNEETYEPSLPTEETNSDDSIKENTDTNVSTEEETNVDNTENNFNTDLSIEENINTVVDSTSEENTLEINDSVEDEQISTVATDTVEFLNTSNLRSNLPKEVTNLYFGTASDYDLSKCDQSQNIGNGYTMYSHRYMNPNVSYDIYVICDNAKQIIFPTNSCGLFKQLQNLKQITFKNIDTHFVTDMSYMFYDCNSLNSLDLSSFNTENVTNMKWMFSGCNNLTNLNISNFNTSNITDMSCMFYNCTSLNDLDLHNFNTENVTDMSSMFKNCSSLKYLDLSSFSTDKITDMSSMFAYSNLLETIYTTNSFVAPSTSANMFYNCDKLTGGSGTKYISSKTNGKYAHIDGGSYNPGYFTDKNSYPDTKIGYINKTKLKNSLPDNTIKLFFGTRFDYDLSKCTQFKSIGNGLFIYFYKYIENGSEISETYVICDDDKIIIFPEDSSSLFSNMHKLKSITFKHIDTSHVKNMSFMFNWSENIESLDLSEFNTSQVLDMRGMFKDLWNITTLDLSNFNTENVLNMNQMFAYSKNINNLNLSSFNTTNVTDMSEMFKGCTSLIDLNLSTFSTSKVTDMSYMFNNCSNLQTIYTINKFIAPTNSSGNMFSNCNNLIGEQGTTYDSSHTDATYAHIDGGTSNPGYFSCKQHTWDSGVVTTEPTCENKGIKTFTCTKCNTTKTEDIAALGHSYTAETIKTDALKTPGTCTDKAIYYKSCERCGQVDTDENNTFEGKVDSTNHNYSSEWTIDTPASCTQEGSESHHCTRCDAKTGDRPIAKTDHTWDSGVVTTEPTCENKGIKTFTCTKCNTTKTEDIAALGHELTHVTKKDATTEEFGNIEYWNCSKCKKNFKDSEGTNEITGSTVIPKLAPSIIKGDNQSVTEKEEKALSVTSNASYDDFIEVKVDGTTLDISKYTKVKGSTIITLNAVYVSTLSVGTHTLDVVSKFGTATAHFKVEKKVEITPTPETNKSSTTDKTSTGWDDGGPFTTDKCGNVFDRWNNKIYEANGCNVGGYNLVRTSVED